MASKLDFRTISPSQRPAKSASVERRRSGRLRTVYRVARVSTLNSLGLARVLNVSDEGMMLSLKLLVCIGDRLLIDLSESCSLSGTVVWHTPERCGIKLDCPIDSAAMLRRLYHEKVSGVTRQLRVPVDELVTVASDVGSYLMGLLDVSQSGLKLMHDGQLAPGMPVRVQLSQTLSRRGVVRWSDGRRAGVALLEPISVEELGSAASFGGHPAT